MRFFSNWILMIFLVVMTLSLFAHGQEIPPIPEVSSEDFLKLLLESLGGIKGASSLVVAGIVVKLTLSFFSTPLVGSIFKKLEGHVKLTIVLGLSMISGVISLRISGLDWAAALIHSSTMSAFIVLANQIYQQYIKKDE